MDSGEAKIDKIAIDRILKRAELKDRKIVAVSIVGAYRKGKSFILNYFLRYLYFTVSNIQIVSLISLNLTKISFRLQYQSLNLLHRGRFEPRSEKWYQLTDESLKGFSWKDGVERHTTGIVLWSDVFLYESDSEKYAIILIDTQGLFDHDTPDEINSKIFSFTTLISSIQIYNLPNIIHENELQYLQFATEFAKYSMNDECVGKPFGHLLFLIRDWASTSSYNYGFDDGLKYLEEHVLKIKRHQPENMIELRRHIRDSYEKIQCFLMPHPGKIVHAKNFNGSYIGLDEEFLKQLDVLVPGILSPENLQPKKVNGRHITVSDFLSNFNSYSSLFNDKNIPSALSVYESTVNIFMNQLVTKNINFYSNEVQRHLSSIKDLNEFQNIHLKVKESAVDKYTDARKMGSKDQVKSFENLLYHEIEKAHVKLNSTAATIINQKEAKSNNNGLITFIGVLGVLGIAAAVFG